ncbi:hypothetical protein HOY80DRAFT_1134919 [Tuber brumale]|nr:hypothetical protein HOY80DRAFT_1134919 [Tuber brumale]
MVQRSAAFAILPVAITDIQQDSHKSTTSRHDGTAEPPPLNVAVIGPADVGKTSFLQSLVKRSTKHILSSVDGPTAVVMIKERLQTVPECENLPTSMIDISKIADFVLLFFDENLCFAMETMEVLNVIAMHGLPSNIFAILTDLDPVKEIHNLSGLISVMKTPRPPASRDPHYHILADRMVDLTQPLARVEGAKADRKVAWDRYVHGLSFASERGRSYIRCVGDRTVSYVQRLTGASPILGRAAADEKGRKRLGVKQMLGYARMTDSSRLAVTDSAIRHDLHFGSQIRQMKPAMRSTYSASRALAVRREERKARELMHKTAVMKKEKKQKRREWKERKREMYTRDEYWAKVGKRRNTAGAGGGEQGQRCRCAGDLTGYIAVTQHVRGLMAIPSTATSLANESASSTATQHDTRFVKQTWDQWHIKIVDRVSSAITGVRDSWQTLLRMKRISVRNNLFALSIITVIAKLNCHAFRMQAPTK